MKINITQIIIISFIFHLKYIIPDFEETDFRHLLELFLEVDFQDMLRMVEKLEMVWKNLRTKNIYIH